MKNKFLSLGLVLTFALAVTAGLPSVSHAGALTSDQVQAIMSLLSSFGAEQSVVNNVQSALTGQPVTPPSTTTWCYTFNNNLRVGSAGNDVTQLVMALNKEGLMTGKTDTFDEAVASAVTGFQEKYRADVLVPSGLQYGTGFVGSATRAKLNLLYGCGNTINSNSTNQPYIVVSSPNGGANFQVNQPNTITWTETPSSANVTYTLRSYANQQVIATLTRAQAGCALKDNCSFNWIPTQTTSNDFIAVSDYANSAYGHSGFFSVVSGNPINAPYISSVSPKTATGGQQVTVNGSGFTPNTSVNFSQNGSIQASINKINLVSSNQITFTMSGVIAANVSSGVYQLSLVNPNGNSNLVNFMINFSTQNTTCSSGQTWNGSVCVATQTQTYTNASDASVSATVLNSFTDHAGTWGQFNGGGGIITTGDSDWNISLSLTLGSTKTIKSISVYHTGSGAPSSTEGWSTASSDDMGRNDFPLVVFQNNTQLNTAYDKTFGPLQAGTYQYVLYGQVETPNWYGGKVVVDFTDGTQTTAPILASSYVPLTSTTNTNQLSTPTLSSVLPVSGIYGSNAQLTLYGTGLTASTQVSFTGPVGVSAVNTQVSALAAASDGTWLTVQTPASLVPGTYNIRAINTNGESARVVFTVTQVQAQSSLSVTDATPPSATIVPGTLGTLAAFSVSVQGGSNVSVSGMSFHLANVSSDTSGASASLATGVVLADASGNVVAGPVTMGTDGTTNIVFSGPITFPNGTATYYLKGVLNPSYWATSAYTHISTAPSSSWTNPVNQGSGAATILTSSLVSGNVLVQPPLSSSSQQPTVSAGPNQTVTLSTNPLSVPLNGSVNANGYTGTINTIWTKVSGPSNVEFYNLSTGATTRYSPSGNAVFDAAGTYVLQLQATDSNGNTLGSDQTTIYVFQPVITTQPPTISTFSGPATLAVGQYGTWNLLANFSASQGIVSAYQVDFGDVSASQTPFKGNISSGSQIFISKVYNVPGTYNITATVSVAPGVSASKTTSVVVSCLSGQTQSAAGQCVNVPAPIVSLSGSILGTYTSQAGAWNVFQPSGQPNWNWSAALSLTGNTAKTISSMIVTNSNGETWSTSNPGNYPLVVFTNGKQLDTAYGQSLGIYQPNQTYSFTLFGEIASQTLNSATLMVQFSDGTSATANLGGATYKPTITNTATSYVQNNMTASAVDAWQSMINALRLENPELYR
ncbi:hypothetical protein KGQ31_00770 [Patescibacteria group bacterium]|nr:hypothetical protein [Patescibacteria group bacterium]